MLFRSSSGEEPLEKKEKKKKYTGKCAEEPLSSSSEDFVPPKKIPKQKQPEPKKDDKQKKRSSTVEKRSSTVEKTETKVTKKKPDAQIVKPLKINYTIETKQINDSKGTVYVVKTYRKTTKPDGNDVWHLLSKAYPCGNPSCAKTYTSSQNRNRHETKKGCLRKIGITRCSMQGARNDVDGEGYKSEDESSTSDTE